MSEISNNDTPFNVSGDYLQKNKIQETRQTAVLETMEKQQMRQGQKFIIAGFGVAIIGIILYCMAAFSSGFSQNEPIFIKESLAVTGAGTLIWLVGAVKYLKSAIDLGASDDDLL